MTYHLVRNSKQRKLVFGLIGILFSGAFLAGIYSGWRAHRVVGPPSVQFGISVKNGDLGKQLRDVRKQVSCPVNLVALDYFWDDDYPFDAVQFISKKGAVPVLRWMPLMSDSFEQFSFSMILSGTWDEQIRRWAQRALESEYPVVIALFSDFNREEMGIEDVDKQSSQFVDSARYIIKKFKDEKANNVVWVWQASNDFAVVSPEGLKAFYPGDGFVDWIGLSISYTPMTSLQADFNRMCASMLPTSNQTPVMLTVADVRPFPDQIQWANEGLAHVMQQSPSVSIKVFMLDVPEAFPYKLLNPVFKSTQFQPSESKKRS